MVDDLRQCEVHTPTSFHLSRSYQHSFSKEALPNEYLLLYSFFCPLPPHVLISPYVCPHPSPAVIGLHKITIHPSGTYVNCASGQNKRPTEMQAN